jgi:hypothetical protein
MHKFKQKSDPLSIFRIWDFGFWRYTSPTSDIPDPKSNYSATNCNLFTTAYLSVVKR